MASIKIFLIGILCLSTSYAQLIPQRMLDPISPDVSLMYKRGLNYLAKTQSSDGYWQDAMGSEPAVVGFALLSILASGQHLESEKYRTVAKKCVTQILSQQCSETGYIGNSMYNHGFSTLALAESYGAIDNPELGKGLTKAVGLILNAQAENPEKAWRYTPTSIDADSTVTGCQIVALLAAQNAGIYIPQDAISDGLAYLETCRTAEGTYGYTGNQSGKTTLTAIALLCQYLAKLEPTTETEKTVSYLKKRLNYRDQYYPFYFEYYMSQALFQASPETWEDWNKRNIRYLKLTQSNEGSWSGNHGTTYSTSAALLSLALNFRFMPIYERF